MHVKQEMLIFAPCDKVTPISYILYTCMKFPNVILCRYNLHNQRKDFNGIIDSSSWNAQVDMLSRGIKLYSTLKNQKHRPDEHLGFWQLAGQANSTCQCGRVSQSFFPNERKRQYHGETQNTQFQVAEQEGWENICVYYESLLQRIYSFSTSTYCTPTFLNVVVQSQVVSDSLDSMDCSTPGFPVIHYLLEFAQTHVH